VIWNRSSWGERDEVTGKRQRIEREKSEWTIVDVPSLRIVDDRLWGRAKARQQEIAKAGERIRAALHQGARCGRYPVYLFSGLLKCNTCTSAYAIHSANEYRCSGYSNRGKHFCANNVPVRRDVLEGRLLSAIRDDLFTEAGIAKFKAAVRRELVERRRAKATSAESIERDLAEVEKKIANIMAAIEDGIRTPSTRTALEAAEAERDRLKAMKDRDGSPLDNIDEILPRVIDRYRKLLTGLGRNVVGLELSRAKAALRVLTGGEIWLTPSNHEKDDRGRPVIYAHLTGDYWGLVRLANDEKQSPGQRKSGAWLNLVAEEGLEPPTNGL
jgi:hypothetical protein